MAEESITPAARFYRLHRDEQLARKKEEYNNRPEVIAKREERRRKLAEKRRRCAYACAADGRDAALAFGLMPLGPLSSLRLRRGKAACTDAT